jgi:DNA-binding transcriptional LysR family regulator
MDLNDLRYFALIVEHGGFSAAERHAHITKSKLSRRVALLEERLGARLFQRSTRRLALTEAGRAFYEHCAAIVVEAEAAHAAVDHLRSEPSGTVRLTCPLAMAQFYVARLVAGFMRDYPKVRVELDATDRVVNLIEERFDLALRARDAGLRDPGLTARRIASGRLILVAGTDYAASLTDTESPEALARHDTVGALADGPEQTWSLVATDGRSARILHRPRLRCSDFTLQYLATLEGAGIGLLPQRVVWRALEEGRLVRLCKEWGTPEQDIHLVFASRRGLLPSVRALIDYLAMHIPTALVG